MGSALLNEIDKNRRQKPLSPFLPYAKRPEVTPRQFNQGAASRRRPVTLATTAWDRGRS